MQNSYFSVHKSHFMETRPRHCSANCLAISVPRGGVGGCDKGYPQLWSLKYLQTGPLRSVCSLCLGDLEETEEASAQRPCWDNISKTDRDAAECGWLPGTHSRAARIDWARTRGPGDGVHVSSGTHRSYHFPPESCILPFTEGSQT